MTTTKKMNDSQTIRMDQNFVSLTFQKDTVFELDSGKYKILDYIAQSGEAEVYLIQNSKKEKFVFKYYYSNFKPKEEVLKKIKQLKHPDIINLIEYGYYQNRFYEILEYAEGGSLKENIPIKEIKELKRVIREINNALGYCHQNKIIHRDIKPENIFFLDRKKKDIKIGDFGISTKVEEDYSKKLTGIARTEIYAAPELYQNIGGKTIINEKVDYYALGITILYVYTGEEPFLGLSEYAIMKIKCEGKIKIPEDLPKELKQLLRGLLTLDPNKRWGYKEVEGWLEGKVVKEYFEEGQIETSYKPFPFGYIENERLYANSPEELSELMEKYPDLGVKHLYTKEISKWLKSSKDPLYTRIDQIVEEDYPTNQNAGLILAIYILNPNLKYKSKMGTYVETSEELAEVLEQEFSFYKKTLQKGDDEFYLFLEARGYKKIADTFRDYFKLYSPDRALNTIILQLDNYSFRYKNKKYYHPSEILQDEGNLTFLANDLLNPDSKFSIWLEKFPNLANSISIYRKNNFPNSNLLYAVLTKENSFGYEKRIFKTSKELKNYFANRINSLKSFLQNVFNIKALIIWLENYKSEKSDNFFIELFQQLKGTNISKKELISMITTVIQYYQNNQNFGERDNLIQFLKEIDPDHNFADRQEKEQELLNILLNIKIKKQVELLLAKEQILNVFKRIVFAGIGITLLVTFFNLFEFTRNFFLNIDLDSAKEGKNALVGIFALVGLLIGIFGGFVGAIVGLLVGGLMGYILVLTLNFFLKFGISLIGILIISYWLLYQYFYYKFKKVVEDPVSLNMIKTPLILKIKSLSYQELLEEINTQKKEQKFFNLETSTRSLINNLKLKKFFNFPEPKNLLEEYKQTLLLRTLKEILLLTILFLIFFGIHKNFSIEKEKFENIMTFASLIVSIYYFYQVHNRILWKNKILKILSILFLVIGMGMFTGLLLGAAGFFILTEYKSENLIGFLFIFSFFYIYRILMYFYYKKTKISKSDTNVLSKTLHNLFIKYKV